MRKIDQLLNEYGESHQNAFNKKVHWICVPLIFWSVVAMLWSLKLPFQLSDHLQANAAIVATVLVLIYYVTLSLPLTLGMALWTSVCLLISQKLESIQLLPLWGTALIIFVLAWIGQFYGHKIEGKKPSFFKDLQFLLIGPAWLMHFIFKKLSIAY
jgi:uncharacterized membrane protein YGL010W